MSQSGNAVQYRMRNQNFFINAPVSKAWICFLLIGSICQIFYTANRAPLLANFNDILYLHNIGKLFIFKSFYNSNTPLTGCIILVYYFRLIERRFGSKKFLNFVVVSQILSLGVEIVLLFVAAHAFKYDYKEIPISRGPLAVLITLYLTFMQQFPVVPYANFFRLPISVHNFPLIVLLFQVFDSKSSAFTSGFAGIIVSYLHRRKFFRTVNLIPAKIARMFSANSNLLGYMTEKFVNFGESLGKEEVLPIAATLESQRAEIIQEYERRLMRWQMRNLRVDDQGDSSNFMLGFLQRLHNRSSGDVSSWAAPPSSDLVRQLMDMGFSSESSIIDALRRSDNDVSHAASLLLELNH